MRSLRQAVRRAWRVARLFRQLERTETAKVSLRYPPQPWFRENAPRMLEMLDGIASRLEDALGLLLPPGARCLITDHETAEEIQGTPGAAYSDWTLIGIREGHLSELAGIGAHELAHLMAATLGSHRPSFKAEGFACYAAALVEPEILPCGLPVHHHHAWLRSVGVRVSLAELWDRRDYSPELYDLAWSFATFVAECYGRDRYLRLYASDARLLCQRTWRTLGVTLADLDQEWHAYARQQAPANPREIQRTCRSAGYLAGRAHWVRGAAPSPPAPLPPGGEG